MDTRTKNIILAILIAAFAFGLYLYSMFKVFSKVSG